MTKNTIKTIPQDRLIIIGMCVTYFSSPLQTPHLSWLNQELNQKRKKKAGAAECLVNHSTKKWGDLPNQEVAVLVLLTIINIKVFI